MGSGRYAHVPVRQETYVSLVRLKSELGFKSLDEVVQLLLKAYGEYRYMRSVERVRKVVCGDMLETSAALPVWGKLLAKKLGNADEVTIALGYLVPNPKEPGMYVVSKEKCLSAIPEEEVAVRSEQGVATSKQEVPAAAAGSEPVRLEDYAKNTLVPLLRERVGDRDVWDLREFRKIIESLISLPPSEVIEMLVNLGFAELRGNQVVLKLKQ